MPPSNPQAPSSAMVAIGSQEFNHAVAEAVAAAMAAHKGAEPESSVVVAQAPIVQTPVVVQRTSIDTTKPGPDDLTIRFTRFCTMANCGYQRGQEAGFARDLAMSAIASGSAVLVHDPRLHDARYRRAA